MAGSNAQDSNIKAPDLNESERLALVAFEKVLNKRLSEILPELKDQRMTVKEDGDPSNKALEYLLKEYVLNDDVISKNPKMQELKNLYVSLPDNAQPVALPKDIKVNELASFTGDELALAKFKLALNERLPEILPETKDMALKVNGDPLDGGLIYLLDHYVFNDDKIKQNPKLSELGDLYKDLPDNIRAQTETYKSFFIRPDNNKGLKDQGQAVLEQAQKYLGTSDISKGSDDDIQVKIGEQTSRALRDRIEKLQESGAISKDVKPREFDQRAVDAMDQLVKVRMKDAGITSSSELNSMMVSIWAFNNGGSVSVGAKPPTPEENSLGEAVSLRNILSFIVNAELPSGAISPQPEIDVKWDSQWTNNNSGDRFFNNGTYRGLYGSHTVSTDVLYDKSGYSEENYAILIQASEKLGIDMSGGRTMSELEVGRIATEILTLKAQEAWCFISPGTEFDEKQINEMIHSRQFMPHIDDLAMAEKGLGLPETEFFRKKVEEYGPEKSWTLEFEQRTGVLSYRAQEFAKRFGDIPQYAVTAKAEAENDSEDHIRHSYSTPSLYFGSVRSLFGSTKQTEYEYDRDLYLKKYQKFKEDIGTCEPIPEPIKEPKDDCSVEGVLRGDKTLNTGDCSVESVLLRGEGFSKATTPDETIDDCIKSNVNDATGSDQGECSVEIEVDRLLENKVTINPN